jgi:cation transport ATPase
MSVSQRSEWNVRAGDDDKIEFLHQQVELLWQQLTDVRQEITGVEAALRSALERAEVRQQDAYQQMTGRLEARERRAARVDAHCIWPIAVGIVLTGLPGELAAVAVLGWLSIAASIAVTFWAGRAVMTDQAIRAGS